MIERSNSSRQVGILAGKDLKIFFKDRGSLLFALLFPFVFVLIFSSVMGGAMGTDAAVEVYVATAEADDSLSAEIIQALTQAGTGLVVKEADPDQARAALDQGEIRGYLYFPDGFTEAVLSGEPTDMTVYYNPEGRASQAALTSIAEAVAADIAAYRVMYEAIGQLSGAMHGGAGLVPAPIEGAGVELVYEQVGEISSARAVDLLIPGYLVMFVFFALALTAETIMGEKENYTLERLIAGGATRTSIIGGKFLGSFGRGLIQVVAFWVAGVLIFGVELGNYPLTVILVSVLVALAASGVGVFLATLAKSKKGAGAMAVFVSLSFAAFGGSMWPLFVMPQWLQNLAKITPHAWANSAFNKLMLFGATPVDVVPEMIALIVFAVGFMALGMWRFRLD